MLLAAFVLASACVVITLSPWKTGFADQDRRHAGDIALYAAIVEGIHAGEPFYAVSEREMTERGYPTRSVFNWRAPVPLWLFGHLPQPDWAKFGFGLLALAAFGFAFECMAREGGLSPAIFGGVLLLGSLMLGFLGEIYVMSVVWCGVLIAISLCLYGLGRNRAAALAGLAALFTRELAAPYCVLSVIWALRSPRANRRELLVWMWGAVVYAEYYGGHVWQVLAHRDLAAMSHPEGWAQFLGLPFVLSLLQVHAFLLLLPQWITAILFAASLVCCATWNSAWGQRVVLTICLYTITFGCVGQDFNQYWGAVLVPAWTLAAGRIPSTFYRLFQTAEFSGGWLPKVFKAHGGHALKG